MPEKNKARSIKPSHQKILFGISGNQCAHPDCHRLLIIDDGTTIVGKICHIEAASEGGPRYNHNMTDDERRHFNNLIVLCDEHHSVIDNPENEKDYPVPLLREWKKQHEDKYKNARLRENPRLIIQAIDAISAISFEEGSDVTHEKTTAFDIEPKIKHNAIKRNREIIKEYGPYYARINAIYGELENQASFKKERLLRNIRHIYLHIKGKFINGADNEIKIIQEHADDIFDEVRERLNELVERQSLDHPEDLFFAIDIIMVDAFMRCKILEEPLS